MAKRGGREDRAELSPTLPLADPGIEVRERRTRHPKRLQLETSSRPRRWPEHAWMHDTGRATYVSVTDDEALHGVVLLSRLEGIIPALETAHAVAWIAQSAGRWTQDEPVLLCVSGRGDKDMATISQHELPSL